MINKICDLLHRMIMYINPIYVAPVSQVSIDFTTCLIRAIIAEGWNEGLSVEVEGLSVAMTYNAVQHMQGAVQMGFIEWEDGKCIRRVPISWVRYEIDGEIALFNPVWDTFKAAIPGSRLVFQCSNMSFFNILLQKHRKKLNTFQLPHEVDYSPIDIKRDGTYGMFR